MKTLYILGPVYKTWRTVYMRIWNETLARLEAGHPLFNGVFILRYFLLATPMKQNNNNNNNNKKAYDVIKLKKGVGRDTATAETN